MSNATSSPYCLGLKKKNDFIVLLSMGIPKNFSDLKNFIDFKMNKILF